MKLSALRRISLYAVSLGIAACSAGDRSAPSLPTSPQGAPATGVAAPDSEISMPVTTEGTKPAGFEAVFRVHPKPDTEGTIRGEAPLTVQFDVCGSRTDADKTLTYLFDWDSDHRPNVVGTGDACHQEHTYNPKQVTVTDARGNALFETAVCVVSGNPRVHGPETYFSCRTFRISLPVPPPPKPCAHSLCTTGSALVEKCDSCAASICGADPYCCNKAWDGICVDEVSTVCGSNACGPI